MIDVIYLLGSGSHWENREIRYSMRSLAKHATGIRNLWVVGEKPKFLSGQAHHLAVPDVGYKTHATVHKVDVAVNEIADLTDRFVVMMDDVFLCRDCGDIANWPYTYKYAFEAAPAGDEFFAVCGRNTYHLLDLLGLPKRNYGCHRPIVYDKQVWRSLAPCWRLSETLKYSLSHMMLMGNALAARGVGQHRQQKDNKFTHFDGAAWADEIIAERDCFSIGDGALEQGMGPYIQARYAEPSPWEVV